MDINRIFMELDHNKVLSPDFFKPEGILDDLYSGGLYLQQSERTAIELFISSYRKRFDDLIPTKTYKKQMEKISNLECIDIIQRQTLSYKKYVKDVDNLPRQYKLDFIKNKVWQLQ